MKKTTLIISPLACLLTVASAHAAFVPATSDPWLAGAVDGTQAAGSDSAPSQSPVAVTGIAIAGGQSYQFSVTGWAMNGPAITGDPADGGGISHSGGAQNGIADVTAPINSLIGVFLDSSVPSGTPSGGLDFLFLVGLGLNFSLLSPGLNQPFFIGDGLNGSIAQTFVAPTGATRLFLGTMDGYEWNNNSGGFDVNVSAVPEPSTVIAGALLLLPFGVSTLRKLRNIRA